MKLFKFTFVGPGSALEAAVAHDEKEVKAGRNPQRTVWDEKQLKNVVLPAISVQTYNDTTARYEAMYSEADREWFASHQKRAIANAKANPKAY
jgi:hypothetical protein